MAGEFPTAKVGDLAMSISDTHKMKEERLIFLNTSDILLGKILHRTYTPVKDWPGQAKKSIRRNDILFSEIRPANGRWVYVNEAADDFVVSTKLMVIRSKTEEILPKYLYQFLTSKETSGWLQHLAESRSGTFPQITFDQIAALDIPLPPLPEQRAIAHVLSTLDDLIEANREINETLEEMARALFKSWFVDFDPVRAKLEGRPPAGMDAATAALFPDHFQDSALGQIPKGWEVKPLGSLTSYLSRGIGPSYIEEGGVCVLNQKCIRDHRVDSSKGRRHSSVNKSVDGRLLRRFDVLVNSTGVGTLGRVAQVFNLAEDTIVDSHVTIVRAAPSVDPCYLGGAIISREIEIEELGEGSTGQTELSRARLAGLNFVTPNVKIQQAFGRLIAPTLNLISENDQESRDLAALRDTLLPKLLSGEVSVERVGKRLAEIRP